MRMTGPTFFWHDYETFGVDPRIDRPSQFAGIRTDQDFNVIGEPVVLYCRPANDFLPSMEACLITGITPQLAYEKGLPETEFFKAIHREMMEPSTCSLGYNSIRFDDEMTRHGFYRNLQDAYEREYKNGNSRWDLINVMRMLYTLRPDKFNWPVDDNGRVTFRLEKLTEANGIEHDDAHDALSDVRATIALAKLVKEREPKFFDFMLKNRGKHAAADMLQIGKPVLHVSPSYSMKSRGLALVLPIAKHPTNNNGVIVYDLSIDPAPLLKMSANDIKQHLFTREDELPEGAVRVPLRVVQINKCPALAPRSVLRHEDAVRLNFRGHLCDHHLHQIILDSDEFRQIQNKVSSLFEDDMVPETDPDLMLYGGPFLGNGDKRKLDEIRRLPPHLLDTVNYIFSDGRLPEMVFRYRARNFPEFLSTDEKTRWDAYRLTRIAQYSPYYLDKLDSLLSAPNCSEKDRSILLQLKDYALFITKTNVPAITRVLNEVKQGKTIASSVAELEMGSMRAGT